jgi:hypothetical protein
MGYDKPIKERNFYHSRMSTTNCGVFRLSLQRK